MRNYSGSRTEATSEFERESRVLARAGYDPTAQSWIEGSRSTGTIILALLLCIFVIGLLILIPLLMTKPPGTLAVTYRRTTAAPNPSSASSDESTRPGDTADPPIHNVHAAGASSTALLDALERLVALRDAGALMDDEFAAVKATLLDR